MTIMITIMINIITMIVVIIIGIIRMASHEPLTIIIIILDF